MKPTESPVLQCALRCGRQGDATIELYPTGICARFFTRKVTISVAACALQHELVLHLSLCLLALNFVMFEVVRSVHLIYAKPLCVLGMESERARQ